MGRRSPNINKSRVEGPVLSVLWVQYSKLTCNKEEFCESVAVCLGLREWQLWAETDCVVSHETDAGSTIDCEKLLFPPQ